MKRVLLTLLALLLTGCAIADRSDKFGAEFELGIGGLLAYVADIKLKASVGFSKTCLHQEEQYAKVEGDRGRSAGDRRGFL